MVTIYRSLRACHMEGGMVWFLVAWETRTRTNGFKIQQGRFQLNKGQTRKHLLSILVKVIVFVLMHSGRLYMKTLSLIFFLSFKEAI